MGPSSSRRNLRSLHQTPRPQPAPETTSYADAGGLPGSDVPPGPDDPHPKPIRYGPSDPKAAHIAEANERRGATTATGYIGPSKIHRQPAVARTQQRKADRAHRRNRRSSAVRRSLLSMQSWLYLRSPSRAISSCLPRDRRDITVPIGTLVISAISR